MTRTTTNPATREQLRTMRAENLAASEQLELIAAEHAKECAAWGDLPGDMHTIRRGRLMIKALAKSAERLAAKFRSASARLPARREPSAGSRSYPTFTPGESTADYLARFATLNGQALGFQMLPYNLSAYLHPCTLYEGNALDFEPIEQPADAPELSADALQPVAIVSALTGATLGTVPRHVADQVAELIASATTAAVIEQASEAAPMATLGEPVQPAVGSRAGVVRGAVGSDNTVSRIAQAKTRPGRWEVVSKAAQNIDTTAQPVANQAESVQVNDAQATAQPKQVPPFPVEQYRVERHYANGAKIKPLPAKSFTPEQVRLISDWFKSVGWDVGASSGPQGVTATNVIGMTADDVPEPYTAAQRKKDAAEAGKQDKEAQKKKTQSDYLTGTDAGRFVAAMFGDAMNGYNSFALAKVLAGDAKKFEGLFSGRAIDVLQANGVRTEGRNVDDVVGDIKAMFDQPAAQATAQPEQAEQKATHQADQSEQTGNDDETERERRLNTFDAMTATAADVQAMGAEYVAQLLDDLEDINYHTEGLILQALATVDACSEPEASATTCDASSASNAPSAPQNGRVSSAQHQAPTKPTHDAHGQRIGQRVAGRSGHWCAVMFTDPDGRPSFEFDGPGGLIEVLTFATGRERMAALQAMARQAEQAAQTSNDDETDRERRLNAFDAMTATAADVQAMGAEYVAQLLEDLEDINYHTEGLILQCLAAGREDLAARARANLREHLAAGFLTDALREDRQAIGEALRQSTNPDPTRAPTHTPSSDPTSAQGYAPPAPDAHQQTAPVPNLADKVPRAVGADSGPASNPPGATAPSAPAPSAPAPSAPAPDTEASADEPEPEFTRAAPQPFDMLAMIAAGLAPADFVGLGIVYSGDRANPSGCGAITDVQPCSWYKFTVMVTLEDGRQSRLNPVSFTDSIGNRFRTNFKRHGAPYLAELSAARLAVEAADKAAKQAAADDKARQRRELPQQWPQLKAYDPAGKLNGPTLAAHNIRVLLKERFPKIKFSVRSDRYSGGDAIDIRWTDGPNTKAVEKIADQFEAGSFNGQEDIYEYAHSVFRDLFGDAKYIHCNRDISDALLAQAIEAEYPSAEGRPTVDDYRKARGAFSYEHRNEWAARRIRERLETMGAGLPS